MIKKEDYEKALSIVQDYNVELNSQILSNRTCCICKKNVIKKYHADMLNPMKQESGMWDTGTVERIDFGYGSRFDRSSFYIAVCDDCIETLEKEGLATNLKDIRKEVQSYGAND